MRRPLALWGFTFLGCSLCYLVFGLVSTWLLLAAAFAGTIACLFFYSTIKQQPIGWSIANIFLAVVLSCTLLFCGVETTVSPVEAYYGKEESIRMIVQEERGHYDRTGYYTATTDSLTGRSVRIKLQTQGDARYQVGDVIEGTVQLEQPSTYQEKRLLSERIALVAKTDPDQPLCVVNQTKNIYHYASLVKRVLYKNIHTVLPAQTASMVAGICLGETAALPQSVITQFHACGMSHMTAVSGLHTTMLVGFLVALFVLLRWNRRWANLLGVVLIWTFVFVVGVPVSAVRAGVMFTLMAVASWFRYPSDSLNNLGGAVLVILMVSPFAAGDISFMASVSACVGLIVYSVPCAKLLRRAVPRKLRETNVVVRVTNGLGIT
ncbi:MAG: ComEC/Rec2 family competence protein, partial [Clostridia bacterium]|nr:ComEC/Rec2 family competence protein [Clostridia bacterium]